MVAHEDSTTHGLLLLAAALALLVGGATVALPSCGGPPDKTCYADHVNALGVEEDAGPIRDCTTCLQAKSAPKSCCDAVGACDEDPTKACAPSFKAAHLCVADGGPGEEAHCKGLLTNDLSKNLYSCMRDTCATECQTPNCTLDKAVVLIANPECDRCVGGLCCERINKCYGQDKEDNRPCKLIVECIATHCTTTLGSSMTELGQAPPDQRKAARDAVCGGGPVPGASPACLQRCLDDFAPIGDGSTGDALEARCDAFDVFTCGAEAKCGPKCVQPDSGPYSAGGTWPDQ